MNNITKTKLNAHYLAQGQRERQGMLVHSISGQPRNGRREWLDLVLRGIDCRTG